uniref:UPAR/Ly6 domain-containing protein n=1 Tax=Panagrolaimus superbus TaxID=310955 RepID=A0A914XW90_9BILA
MVISGPNFATNCTQTGTTTISGSGYTGQYDCCNDKDSCNSKSLNPDATNNAIKPFAIGFVSIFVILASLF